MRLEFVLRLFCMPLRSERRRLLEEEIKLNFRSKCKTILELNFKKKMEKSLFFSNLRNAEDYFDLPRNSLHSKISKNDPSIISKKTEMFSKDYRTQSKSLSKTSGSKRKGSFPKNDSRSSVSLSRAF